MEGTPSTWAPAASTASAPRCKAEIYKWPEETRAGQPLWSLIRSCRYAENVAANYSWARRGDRGAQLGGAPGSLAAGPGRSREVLGTSGAQARGLGSSAEPRGRPGPRPQRPRGAAPLPGSRAPCAGAKVPSQRPGDVLGSCRVPPSSLPCCSPALLAPSETPRAQPSRGQAPGRAEVLAMHRAPNLR